MAEVSGSVLSVVTGPGAWASASTLLSSGVLFQISPVLSDSPSEPRRDLLRCDGEWVDFLLASWSLLHKEVFYLDLKKKKSLPTSTHPPTWASTWCEELCAEMPTVRVGWGGGVIPQKAEVCLVYDQAVNVSLPASTSLLTHTFLKLIPHMPPLHHDENTQVVPGGETVEGEPLLSFQEHN